MMIDHWIEHLKKHDVFEIHHEAQTVGYRVRVATSYTFDIEYEGGYSKYYGRGLAIKTFENSDEGKAEARSFLEEVGKDIVKGRIL